MNDLGTLEIKGKRIVLRRFNKDDYSFVYENWAGDREVTKYLNWHHRTERRTRKALAYVVKSYRYSDSYQWAISLKNTREAIGGIGAEKIGQDIEVGYCLAKEFWNQGIATEALALVTEFFFERVGADRINLRYDSRNKYSGRVMENAGYHYRESYREFNREIIRYSKNIEEYEREKRSKK